MSCVMGCIMAGFDVKNRCACVKKCPENDRKQEKYACFGNF